MTVKLCVPARDRDIVKEDVGIWVPAGRGYVLIKQESGTDIGTTLHYKQR